MDDTFRFRSAPRRTQRSRPVFYRNEVQNAVSLGVPLYDNPDAIGLVPAGNNVYAAALNDLDSPYVTVKIYGNAAGNDEGSYDFYGVPWSESDEDAPFWFSRTISRSALLDATEGYASPDIAAQQYDRFLQDLGDALGYDLLAVYEIQLWAQYGERGF